MTVQSCAGEKRASQLKPQLNKTTKQCPLGVLCREERSWDGGWGFVQGSTKKLSDFTVCKALPYIMKHKDISPSARDPPGAKQAVFMLELQFLLKTFHCEGHDFFNITEHKVNKVFSRNKTSKGQLDPTWYILQHYVYQLSQDLWRFVLFWHSSVTLKKQEITCQNLKNLAISAKIHQSWPATDVQGFDSHCPKTHTKRIFAE